MQVKFRQQNFEDENFVDGQFTAKTSKITICMHTVVQLYGKNIGKFNDLTAIG